MANNWKVKFTDDDSQDYQVASFPTEQSAKQWIKICMNQERYDPTGFEVVEGPYAEEQKINIWFDSIRPAPNGFKWIKTVEDFIDGIFVDIDKDFNKIGIISLDTKNDMNGHSFKDILNRAENDNAVGLKVHVHGNDVNKKNKMLKQAEDNNWEIVDDLFEDDQLLTEGKHWPEDYIKTAYNTIKNSSLGKQSWYSDSYIQQDIKTFADEFSPLSHKNSNLGFFSTIIKWFIAYSGISKEKYQEFIERKLDGIIGTLQTILNDPSYDKIKDEIKQKWTFEQFEELQKKINDEAKASSDERLQNIVKRDDYDLIPIYSYEELHEKFGGDCTGWHGQSEWCHTNGKSTYESWTKNGTQMFFVLAKKDWQKVFQPEQKPTGKDYNAYDEYGLSLIAILVDTATCNLLNETLRWNHVVDPSLGKNKNPGASVDKAFKNNWGELSQAVGMDVKNEVAKLIKDQQNIIKKRQQNANEECERILKNAKIITDVTIPKEIRKLITKVDIPNNVTSIDSYAFNACNELAIVTIPDSVTSIGQRAFNDCSGLSSLTISDGVMSIGYCAFNGCSSLTSVTIPGSVTSIEYGAFAGCISLSSITIPDSVTSIGEFTFIDCSSLTSVTIPDSVIDIGDGAFRYCSRLTNLSFKGKTIDQVKAMENYPFGIEDESIIKCETKNAINEMIQHNNIKLWVDDIRPAPKGYIWIKSTNDFIDYLVEHGIYGIEVFDFDHDAGEYANDGGDYIKCLDYLEKIGADNINVRIHSENPVGRKNMEALIKKNQWNEVFDIIDEDEIEESMFDGGDYRALLQAENDQILNEVDVVSSQLSNPTYANLISALSKIDPSTPIRILAIGHEAYTSNYYGHYTTIDHWKIDVNGMIVSNQLTKSGKWKCIVRDVPKDKACPAIKLIEWLQKNIEDLDEQIYIWPGFSSKGQIPLVDNRDNPTHIHKVKSFELSEEGTLDLNLSDVELCESMIECDQQLDEAESIDEAEDSAKKDKLIATLKKASKDFQNAASNYDPEQFSKIVVAFDDLMSGVGAYDFKKKKVLKEEEINEAAVQKTYGKYGERLKEIIHKKQKWYDPKEVDDVISFLGYSSRNEYLNDYPSGNSQTLRYVLQLAHEKEKKQFEKEQQLKKFNSKAGNSSITGAKLRKDDQYFIPLHEAIKILFAYKPFLSGKNILCNCDDPRASQTFKAIVDNFSSLGIKSATAIGMPPGYETDKQAYMQMIDENGLGPLIPVSNGGDFRIGESSDLLSKCDVVVSNPPFSKQDGDDIGLFQQFMLKILKANKDVIAIGPLFGVSYDGIKNYIISSKLFAVKSPFQKFGRPDKTDAQIEIDILTGKKDNYNAPVALFSTFKNDAFGTPIDFSSKTTSELPLVYIDDYASDFPIAINDKDKFSIANSIPISCSEDKRLDGDNNEYILCPITIFRKNWIDVFDVESFPKKIIYNGKELFQSVLMKYKK